MDKVAFSIDEAAEAVGRSRSRIKKAIRDGELLARRDNKRVFIMRSDLIEWLDQKPKVPVAVDDEAVTQRELDHG